MNLIETNPDLTKLLLLEARQSGKFLRSTAIDKIACYCSLIEEVLREGVEEGWIRPELECSVAATVLYCGIEGIATRWVLENQRGSLEETAKAIIDLFIQGVRNPQK
jgi:TetR/AcrR family fatty acid metabolism transcriptional regulator